MSRPRRVWPLVALCLAGLPVAPPAAQEAAQSSDQQTCVNDMNKYGLRVAKSQNRASVDCGRRIDENGGDGTDHGHGGVMMAMGGGIVGGRVILRDGQWPGLAPAQRYIGQDLQVTTDFRDVFAEALDRHMGLAVAQMGPIFPNFSASTSRFPGLYA
jgi:uncharacterized protein (DUF1501 family)